MQTLAKNLDKAGALVVRRTGTRARIMSFPVSVRLLLSPILIYLINNP